MPGSVSSVRSAGESSCRYFWRSNDAVSLYDDAARSRAGAPPGACAPAESHRALAPPCPAKAERRPETRADEDPQPVVTASSTSALRADRRRTSSCGSSMPRSRHSLTEAPARCRSHAARRAHCRSASRPRRSNSEQLGRRDDVAFHAVDLLQAHHAATAVLHRARPGSPRRSRRRSASAAPWSES